MANPAVPSWAPSLIVAAILFAIGFALYEITLPFPFAFDDYPYLLDNPLWQDARSFLFPREFTDFANRAARLRLESDLSTNFILRPVSYLTFHLNLLAGGLAPAGYRAVNIFIHCANATLVFALVSQLCRLAGGAAPTRGSRRFISWTAALIFLVHPLQTESVTYIIQRFTSLGTAFFLGSVLLFVRARMEEDAARARRWRHCSVATLLGGMLTKEFVFVAPLAMLLIDRVIAGTPFRAALRSARPWLLCLPLIPALLLLTAAAQHPGNLSLDALLNVASPMPSGPHATSQAAYQHRYALSQPSVILTYLRLLVLPRGLNLDPDYPVTASAWEWRFLGPFSGILLLIGIASWRAVRRPSDPRGTLAAFGMLWFFLTLSIDSSIVPLPDLMAEHRTYLPSVGFVIAIASLADLARTRSGTHAPMPWLVPTGVAAALLGLATATVARNQVWRSPVTLWTDTVAKSPNKMRPWMNLGTAYHQSERWSPSLESYRHALRLGPVTAQLWSCLAVAENAVGAYARALHATREGLRLNPAVENLHLAAAFAHERLGQRHDARASLLECLRHIPDSRRARLGLVGFSLELGDDAEAARQLENLRALGPLDPEQQRACDRLAAALAERGKLRGAQPQEIP